MRRSWRLKISIAVVIASIQTVSAQEPIRLGVLGPHSGPALGGQSTLLGAQIAAQEINAVGGLLGGRKRAMGLITTNKPSKAEAVQAVELFLTAKIFEEGMGQLRADRLARTQRRCREGGGMNYTARVSDLLSDLNDLDTTGLPAFPI